MVSVRVLTEVQDYRMYDSVGNTGKTWFAKFLIIHG